MIKKAARTTWILGIAATLVLCLSSPLYAAWLGTWEKRVEITVSNTNIDSDVTHFPLLLTLGTSVGTGNDDVSFIFDELTSDANRKKIALTKSDGTTQIYCEIEKWDDANEQAWLWVSKSDLVLASGSTTTLYLYYDSSQPDNTAYVGDGNDSVSENVWASHWKTVHHLEESDIDGGAGDIKDSTSNNNDGTTVNMDSNDDVSAKIGIGFDFGTISGDEGVNLGDDPDLEAGANEDYTIMGWMYRRSNENDDSIFNKRQQNVPYEGWALNSDRARRSQGLHGDGDGTDAVGTDAYHTNLNGWYHFLYSVDRSGNMFLMVNGVSAGSNQADYDGDMSGSPEAYIGRNSSGYGDINGILDEIRYSASALSTAWAKAEFYSQDDNLVSWGSEVANSAPSAPQTPYCNNTTAQSGATNPTNISDTTPAFSAIYDDANTSDTSSNYQVQVATDNTFTDLPSGWWDANYRYRQKLTVSNSGASIAEAGYSVKTTVDTAALQTASKVRSDRRDWRVAWQPSDTNRSVSFVTDDYVDSGVDFSWNNTNSITMSCWIKPNNITDTNAGFIGKINPDWEWAFYQNAAAVSLVYWDTGGNHTNGMDAGWGDVLTAGQWIFLTYTWDGSTSRFYADGVLKNTHTATNPAINQNRTNSMMIGGHIYVWGDKYFNGNIDDVRVWNVGLTPEQINARMYTRLRGDEPGLVGYWRFDEGSGTVALDSSGNGNHGTLTNGPTWSTTGQVPCAGEIARHYKDTAQTWFKLQAPIAGGNSSDSYYAYYGNSDEDEDASSDLENVYMFGHKFSGTVIDTGIVDYGGGTITQDDDLAIVNGADAWDTYVYTDATYARAADTAFMAKFKADSGTRSMIGWHDSGTGASYSDLVHAIYFNNGLFYVYEDGSNRGIVGGYTVGTWYDIKIELKSTGAKYYYKATTSSTWTELYDSSYSSESNLRPGIAHYDVTQYSHSDDWVIYEYLSTEPSVSASSEEEGINPSSWLDANYAYKKQLTVTNNVASVADAGHSVKTTEDTAALQTAGKVRSDRRDWRVMWEPSDTNRSVSFDGSNDYIGPTNLGVTLGSATLEVWINPDEWHSSPTVLNGILGTQGWDAAGQWFIRQKQSESELEFGVNANSPEQVAVGSFAEGYLSTWTHIAVTYNTSTKKVKIYLNGQLKADTTLTTAQSLVFDDFVIANEYDTGNRHFNGKIDEVRVWNTVLTQEQINAHMYERLRGDEPGLVGYWRFDEGSGTAALDSSGNGNHGTLTNGPTWSTTGQVPCAGEIARHYAGTAETWFKLQEPIAASGSSNKYYAYYDNSDEDTGPSSIKNNVYMWYDDFESYAAGSQPDEYEAVLYGNPIYDYGWSIKNDSGNKVLANWQDNNCGGGTLVCAGGGRAYQDICVDVEKKIVTYVDEDQLSARLHLRYVSDSDELFSFICDRDDYFRIVDAAHSTQDEVSITINKDTWYDFQAKAYGTNFKVTLDGANERTLTGVTDQAGKLGLMGWEGETYFDDLKVRKYLSTEPTISSGSETANGGGGDMWNSGKTSMSSTNENARCPDISYAGSSLDMDGATYYWRIKFWDNHDAEGAWSATQQFSFTTNTAPSAPTIALLFDNEKVTATPAFKFTGTDPQSDNLDYQIRWDTDINFGLPTTKASANYPTDAGWTAATFTSGTQVTYTVQSALTNGTTYWWQVQARDPAGTNTWSGWTTARSFTIDTSVTKPTWHQTTKEQFDNDVATGTVAPQDATDDVRMDGP